LLNSRKQQIMSETKSKPEPYEPSEWAKQQMRGLERAPLYADATKIEEGWLAHMEGKEAKDKKPQKPVETKEHKDSQPKEADKEKTSVVEVKKTEAEQTPSEPKQETAQTETVDPDDLPDEAAVSGDLPESAKASTETKTAEVKNGEEKKPATGHAKEHGKNGHGDHEHHHKPSNLIKWLKRIGYTGLIVGASYLTYKFIGAVNENMEKYDDTKHRVEDVSSHNQSVDSTASIVTEGETPGGIAVLEQRMSSVFGPDALSGLKVTSVFHGEQEKNDLEIIGFENNPNLPSEAEMRAYVQTLPKSFRPPKIAYVDQENLVVEVNGQIVLAEAYYDNTYLNLSRHAANSADSTFFKLINHEVGHEADPFNNNFLNYEDRVTLLHMTWQRVNAPDHHDSAYPYLFVDPLTRTMEYFAEISRKYFQDRTLLNPADRALIEFVIERTDPGYDYERSQATRNSIVERNE
jgi:hypothetical protein